MFSSSDISLQGVISVLWRFSGWQQVGQRLYPGKKELLITAYGGGSNEVRNRLRKKKLQELANAEQLSITVAHYPPATSKWKKIEHRLFFFISINWRAKPLISLEVVLDLISHTPPFHETFRLIHA